MLLGEDRVVTEHRQTTQTLRKHTVGLAVCNLDYARNEQNHRLFIDNFNSCTPYRSVHLILGTHDAEMIRDALHQTPSLMMEIAAIQTIKDPFILSNP